MVGRKAPYKCYIEDKAKFESLKSYPSNIDGERAHGLYHRIRQVEHTRLLVLITRSVAWMTHHFWKLHFSDKFTDQAKTKFRLDDVDVSIKALDTIIKQFTQAAKKSWGYEGIFTAYVNQYSSHQILPV